jgi:hypothetical protein
LDARGTAGTMPALRCFGGSVAALGIPFVTPLGAARRLPSSTRRFLRAL